MSDQDEIDEINRILDGEPSVAPPVYIAAKPHPEVETAPWVGRMPSMKDITTELDRIRNSSAGFDQATQPWAIAARILLDMLRLEKAGSKLGKSPSPAEVEEVAEEEEGAPVKPKETKFTPGCHARCIEALGVGFLTEGNIYLVVAAKRAATGQILQVVADSGRKATVQSFRFELVDSTVPVTPPVAPTTLAAAAARHGLIVPPFSPATGGIYPPPGSAVMPVMGETGPEAITPKPKPKPAPVGPKVHFDGDEDAF